jgi:hypothetical protein
MLLVCYFDKSPVLLIFGGMNGPMSRDGNLPVLKPSVLSAAD